MPLFVSAPRPSLRGAALNICWQAWIGDVRLRELGPGFGPNSAIQHTRPHLRAQPWLPIFRHVGHRYLPKWMGRPLPDSTLTGRRRSLSNQSRARKSCEVGHPLKAHAHLYVFRQW